MNLVANKASVKAELFIKKQGSRPKHGCWVRTRNGIFFVGRGPVSKSVIVSDWNGQYETRQKLFTNLGNAWTWVTRKIPK